MLKECEQIQAFLEITMTEDPNEIINRGNDLQVYLARTGKMLADAKRELNEKKRSEIFDILRKTSQETGATAKAVNGLIDSICSNENYLVDWLERLNRTCTHQLDWCRSVLSKAKEELRLSGNSQTYRNNSNYAPF